jgi:hypothetical protein
MIVHLRAVRTTSRMDQLVWRSIHRETARAANTIVRWALDGALLMVADRAGLEAASAQWRASWIKMS